MDDADSSDADPYSNLNYNTVKFVAFYGLIQIDTHRA